jgi:uncharacterized protein YndB with AHSA1/START domain
MTPTAIVRRLVGASPEVVFDAWLDVGALSVFMCPDPARAAQVECDPRVGGRLRILMVYPDSNSEVLGEYLELDRPRRLRFSWVPDGRYRSIVSVDLEPRGTDQTMMTITHTLLPDELVRAYDEGWTSIARHLEYMFAHISTSRAGVEPDYGLLRGARPTSWPPTAAPTTRRLPDPWV